ncbi:hypothetical protein [Pseudoduganella sp. R-34]|uniref:hypothetical protein n=1 Tax=Pseudoduganella sp. R-34 TaxID=3404062 RepID=UPI003CF144C3
MENNKGAGTGGEKAQLVQILANDLSIGRGYQNSKLETKLRLACPAGIEPATLGLEVRSCTLFNVFRFLHKPLIFNDKQAKKGFAA